MNKQTLFVFRDQFSPQFTRLGQSTVRHVPSGLKFVVNVAYDMNPPLLGLPNTLRNAVSW